MKLSVADLAIIASTLHRSLLIHGAWMFTKETREETLKNVLELMEEIKVDVTEA